MPMYIYVYVYVPRGVNIFFNCMGSTIPKFLSIHHLHVGGWWLSNEFTASFQTKSHLFRTQKRCCLYLPIANPQNHWEKNHSELVGGLEHDFHVSIYIWFIIIPTDFHIFQRGRLNHQPEKDLFFLWMVNLFLGNLLKPIHSRYPRDLVPGRCCKAFADGHLWCLRQCLVVARSEWRRLAVVGCLASKKTFVNPTKDRFIF